MKPIPYNKRKCHNCASVTFCYGSIQHQATRVIGDVDVGYLLTLKIDSCSRWADKRVDDDDEGR
jgi:hypothetical protein